MIEMLPRPPRQPKLRASCDACGAAKLKCDRTRPQCGRCRPLGITCVYGVSRKMGKPRRGKLRAAEVADVSCVPSEHGSHTDRGKSVDEKSHYDIGGNLVGNDTGLSSERFSIIDHEAPTWSAIDVFPEHLMANINESSALQGDFLETSFQNFNSLEFGDEIVSAAGSPGLEDSSTPMMHTKTFQKVDEDSYFECESLPTSDIKSHDCFREAHDILGSLSSHVPNKIKYMPASPPGSVSATAGVTKDVPLDHLLCLLREISEQLSNLLICPCAKSPTLALLHASIISRLLTWYWQAADCVRNPSSEDTAIAEDETSHVMSMAGRSSSEDSSVWSSTTATTLCTGRTPLASRIKPLADAAISPTKMAIGTFDVDDLRVQNALKIQLLSGEMRRAGRLIDQFSSHQAKNQHCTDNYTFGGVDSLCQSLDSWLRGGHARIVDMMKSRLRELNG